MTIKLAPLSDTQLEFITEAIEDYNFHVEEDGYRLDTEHTEEAEMISFYSDYIGSMRDVYSI